MADILASLGQIDKSNIARSRSAELMALQTRFADLHQKAIERPDDAAVRLQLAETAELLGRTGIAGMWYQAAAGLAPRDAAMRFGSVSNLVLRTARPHERTEALTRNVPAVPLSQYSIQTADAVPRRAASGLHGLQEDHSGLILLRLGIRLSVRVPRRVVRT